MKFLSFQQKRLTLEGNIVISVVADAIYVINVGGYIGASTRSEIEYARAQGKEVLYLE